jgi:hypothetical protein
LFVVWLSRLQLCLMHFQKCTRASLHVCFQSHSDSRQTYTHMCRGRRRRPDGMRHAIVYDKHPAVQSIVIENVSGTAAENPTYATQASSSIIPPPPRNACARITHVAAPRHAARWPSTGCAAHRVRQTRQSWLDLSDPPRPHRWQRRVGLSRGGRSHAPAPRHKGGANERSKEKENQMD